MGVKISGHFYIIIFFHRWVRTRWVLLVLFWLGWIGMLAGAIVIIVQAPRCKDIPAMNWWNEGPVYQITDLEAFSEGLKGRLFVESLWSWSSGFILASLKKKKVFFYFLLRCHVYSQNKSWRLHLKCPSLELGNMLWLAWITSCDRLLAFISSLWPVSAV